MKILLMILTFGFVSHAQANRESGGFLVPAAIYVNFNDAQGEMDNDTYDLAQDLISSAQERNWINQVVFTRNTLFGKGILCVQFKESVADFPRTKDFVSAMKQAILRDRAAINASRTQILAGPDCTNIGNANEVKF